MQLLASEEYGLRCLLQVARNLRPRAPDVWVAHTVDALWASYSGNVPRELRGQV